MNSDATTTITYVLVISALILGMIFFFMALLKETSKGEPVGMDTALASIDGTEGGWRMTRGLTYLIALVVVTGLCTFLVVYNISVQHARDSSIDQQSRTIDSLKTVIKVLTVTNQPKKDTTGGGQAPNGNGDE